MTQTPLEKRQVEGEEEESEAQAQHLHHPSCSSNIGHISVPNYYYHRQEHRAPTKADRFNALHLLMGQLQPADHQHEHMLCWKGEQLVGALYSWQSKGKTCTGLTVDNIQYYWMISGCKINLYYNNVK